MKKYFIKKYWEEDNEMYYFHIENGYVEREIILDKNKNEYIKLSKVVQQRKEYFLCDQPLDSVEWDILDYISEEEFETVWNKNQ